MPSYASNLRNELAARSRAYADKYRLPHCEICGRSPVIGFHAMGDGGHGNFLGQSYREILAAELWQKRLRKIHTSARNAFPRSDYKWRELDSSTSSDALLMNIFCFPNLLSNQQVRCLLNLDQPTTPEFGLKARVPLGNNKFDHTEVDMRLGHLLVEAKLTESNFQQKDAAYVNAYRDVASVFDCDALPRTGERILGYQLIRNVLAAYANQCSFCVMLDARRPDLREAWYSVMRCITDYELRVRCQILTWQELTVVLPRPLQVFLAEKYGITSDAQHEA